MAMSSTGESFQVPISFVPSGTLTTSSVVRSEMGKPVAFAEFSATNELRWIGSGKAKRLQQAWYAHGVDGAGYVCAGNTEWRDVPTADEDDNKSRFDTLLSKVATKKR